MLESDRPRFTAALLLTAAIYKRELPKGLQAAWFDLLGHLDVDDVCSGFKLHLQDTEIGQFFPLPAQIISHARGAKKKRLRELEREQMTKLIDTPRGAPEGFREEVQRLIAKLKVIPEVEQIEKKEDENGRDQSNT